MKFCQSHWDNLKHKIQSRGLGDLIAASGEELNERIRRAMNGEKTLQNYDPLMHAHNMILANAIHALEGLGFDPRILLQAQEGVESCPICYMNHLSEEHDKTCDNPDCEKPKGMRFEFWLDKAADSAKEFSETLVNEKP